MSETAAAIVLAPYRPPVHAILYAPAGGYKSTMAADFPKPMLVLGFDPMGKFAPYFRRGLPSPELVGPQGQAVMQVVSRKNPDKLLVQVEGYYDDDVTGDGVINPVGYPRFTSRLPTLYDEVRAGMWKTVVIDTLTSMGLTSRNLHQYSLHKHEKDSRKWYAQQTDDLEKALCCQLVGALRGINFLVLCHVDEEKDEVAGMIVGSVAAPGRLRKQQGLPARFPEMYRLHTKREKDGTLQRWVQTQPDARYNAMSVLLNAPDGCEPAYKALFANYDQQEGGE